MKRPLALFLLILLAAAFEPPAAAFASGGQGGRAEEPYREGGYDPGAESPFAEDDLVILEVMLDRYRVSQGMIGYTHPDGVLLPLGALCDALEFAIETRPNEGWARGWFIAEDRTFSLDLGSRSVFVNGSRAGLNPGLAKADADDIYIDSELFASWFPLDFDIRLSDMLVRIYPREMVPLQSRLKRDEARANSLARSRKSDSDYPLRKAEYRPLSWPLIDANVDYVTRDESPDMRFTLQSSGDVAGLTTRTLLSHSEGKLLTTARLRAGREVNDNSLLGPLGASRYEFGDIYSPVTPLTSRGKMGRGAFLSNQPLRRPTEFSSTTIEGDAPPGWEVELYANGTLLGFDKSNENGHYKFEDVPLQFGNNVFRTVVYGPQGQTRERVERTVIGSDMVQPGDFSYRIFSLQDEKSLFRDDESILNPSPDYGAWNHYAEIGYGMSPWLSLSGSVQRMSLLGERKDYGSIIARNNFFGLYTQAVLAKEFSGGTAGQLSAQGRIGDKSIIFEQRLYDDFNSEYNEPSQMMQRETSLRFSGATQRLLPSGLSYDLKFEDISYAERSINSQDKAILRLASNVNRFSLSNRLEYRRTDTESGNTDNLQGEQLASSWLGNFMLRSQVRYRISPATELQALGGTATWRAHRNLTARLQIIRSLEDITSTQIHTGLSWIHSGMACGLTFSHSNIDRDYVSLNFTTSLAKAPRGGGWHMQRQKMSTGSAAAAFVYLDRDADGRYGRNDEPMADIGFSGSGLWRDVRTNEKGIAFLPGLPSNQAREVELDLETLVDPFLIPTTKGLTAMGHTGGIVNLEFPVTYSGEIEGDVVVRTFSGEIPARHVGLELLNSRGERIKTTVSEFDGYFLFQEVPPGWYEIRVLPHALERRHVKAPAPIAVQIPAEGGVSSGHLLALTSENMTADSLSHLSIQQVARDEAVPITMDAVADTTQPAEADTTRVTAQSPRTEQEIFADESLDLIEKVIELEEAEQSGTDGDAGPRAEAGTARTQVIFPGDTPSPSLPRRYFYGLLERPAAEEEAAASLPATEKSSLLKRLFDRNVEQPPTDEEVELLIRSYQVIQYILPGMLR